MKSMLSAALVAASVVLTAATAQANPVPFIGLQQEGSINGDAIVMYPTGGGPGAAYGTFFSSTNSNFATGSLGKVPVLVVNTIDASNTSGPPLVVWMTVTGNSPLNVPFQQMFESSFTENLLPEGWTVQVDTFLDPADGIFTTTIPLSSHLFTASNLTPFD